MAFRMSLILGLAFIVVVSMGYIEPSAQIYLGPTTYSPVYHDAPISVAHKVHSHTIEKYDPHPQYKFAYVFDDKLTFDSKSQFEKREGGVVNGEYSLIDAVGYKRAVQYTVDPDSDFNAVVYREPIVRHVHAAPVASVAYYAHAPVYQD